MSQGESPVPDIAVPAFSPVYEEIDDVVHEDKKDYVDDNHQCLAGVGDKVIYGDEHHGEEEDRHHRLPSRKARTEQLMVYMVLVRQERVASVTET